MGLLVFKERDPSDETPFRKNEWHVGKSARFSASSRSQPVSSDAIAAEGRSPIRRDQLRRARQMNERAARFITRQPLSHAGRRFYIDRVNQEDSSNSTTTNQQQTDPTRSENSSVPIADNHAQTNEEIHLSRVEDYAVSSSFSNTQPATEDENENERERQQRRDQRRQSFGYVLARARARVSGSRTGSPERNNRWRVASPDTQRVILQQIENQSDGEQYPGLYVADIRGSPGQTLHMSISRADGLGDRRRSFSGEIDRRSDVEENWNSLIETIPSNDANLPSANSSFASDSASSILSRNLSRSSLTSTTAGSRSASGPGTSSRRLPCPESEDPFDLELPSFFRSVDPHHRSRSSSTRPSRIPMASLSQTSARSRSASRNHVSQSGPANPVLETRSHGLDHLDELMDMLSNGTEVPPEMWASVGISPHLGVRGLAARLRRRSERP